MGATASDMGIVTTPQLHWMVRAKNKGNEATELNYYDQILTSFRSVIVLLTRKFYFYANQGLRLSLSEVDIKILMCIFRCLLDYIPQENSSKSVSDKLIVDGADGVGGEKLEKLKTRLAYLTIDIRNCGDGVLNEGVGADYVQKEKVVPRSFGPVDAGMR